MKPGKVDDFLSHWGPLAEFVKANEPDTLAYECSLLEDDPNKIFVYERCGNTMWHGKYPHKT
jgi:quinol monooxygenase YgiN